MTVDRTDLSLTVPGMTCTSCELLVTEELQELEGVDSVDVDLASKRVRVHGHALDEVAIRAALSDAGYEAEQP